MGFTGSTKITLLDRHYRRLQEINQHMKVSTMLQLCLSSIEKVPINFSFSRQHNRVRMNLTENATVEFGVVLARLLGFRHGLTYSNASVLGDQKTRFQSIYAYCDLVEHVPVGDTNAPLLRIVNKTYNGDENVHQTFNPVFYIPLQKKCFDGVEINLMTDTGMPVPFQSGKSFVVLEFRSAAYKYFAF